MRPHNCHHGISQDEICLSHGHIVLLVGFRRDIVKHRWWPLHAEESTHKSAQYARSHLCLGRRFQRDVLADKRKVYACEDEDDAQDLPQQYILNTSEEEDADGRDDDEGNKHGKQSAPCYLSAQSDCDSERCRQRQHPGESNRLAV